MAYTSTEWKTGDVITAERLNKMSNFLVINPNQLTPLVDDEGVVEIWCKPGSSEATPMTFDLYTANVSGLYIPVVLAEVSGGWDTYTVASEWSRGPLYPVDQADVYESDLALAEEVEALGVSFEGNHYFFVPTGTAIAQGTKQGGSQ